MPNLALKNSKLYARLLDTVKPVGAMLSVKRGRPLINHLVEVVRLTGIGLSLGLIKVIITFCSFCFKYIQNNGLVGLVKYLKACSVITQQASGNHKIKSMNPLGVRCARTGRGFPRVIPALHRARIIQGHSLILKFWLTLFSLYRVLEIPSKLKLRSITDPSSMDPSFTPEFQRFLSESFWKSLQSLPGFDDTRMGLTWDEPWDFVRGLRATPFIISKSAASAGMIKLDEQDKAPLSTSPASLLAAVACWHDNPDQLAILKDWCKLTGNQWLINRLEEWNKTLLPMVDPQDPRAPLFKGMRTVLGPVYARSLGRLGFKEEAAGKLRTFAFVDPFTQWAMKPLHDEIFAVLDTIAQDGTTDQLRPVRNLLATGKRKGFWSFDLTAATDRIPLVIQMCILSKFLTAHGANLWAAMLTGRGYEYSYKAKNGVVSAGVAVYGAGQPMGALSSWAMLALTHHAVVQMAAQRAGVVKPGEWFMDYAVLGDDLVIANRAVADEYLILMSTLGVEVGLAKSLVSPDGLTLEFAKRTFHKGEDVSPVPFSEYWVGRQMLSAGLELVRKYSLTLAQYLSMNGFGYRAKGSVTGSLMKLGQRLRHRVLAYYNPLGPNPMTAGRFFSLKGLTKSYIWSERKVTDFINAFAVQQLGNLLERVNSPDFEKVCQFAREISTVNKDREFYGTLSRSQPGARKIDLKGLYPERPTFAWNQADPSVKRIDQDVFYHVVDSICQTVYREAFLDVLVEVRELRYALEDAIKGRLQMSSLEALDSIIEIYYSLQDKLANIPLPKEIYERVEKESRLGNLEMIRAWEKFSRILRSTHHL